MHAFGESYLHGNEWSCYKGDECKAMSRGWHQKEDVLNQISFEHYPAAPAWPI